MNNADRTALDFLISHALNKIISWDELRESLSDELFQSEEMADVLLEIQNKQIDVIDFQQNIRTTETDKYIFITMELYKFKDCIPEIRKQENGKYNNLITIIASIQQEQLKTEINGFMVK